MKHIENFFLNSVVVMVALVALLSMIHIPLVDEVKDYFNPFITMQTDYAKVPKGTQDYYNIQAVDKHGNKLPYKLEEFGGYDPNQQYVVIKHKGQFVKHIDYITKIKMPTAKD
ncbi:YxeA family protein [Lactobacillus sp. ESL0677]|uniref:YxeA family protein n=1 Tax=Lactobacillus sp. ESL0677 TaxID=2983208 RepID=UPI0023F796B7|nr:YxeA family protein [Lactobacillus sp. ESL0677]WEV37579.1 YxeA family protein [Lactobacillus sp. ESL0677]